MGDKGNNVGSIRCSEKEGDCSISRSGSMNRNVGIVINNEHQEKTEEEYGENTVSSEDILMQLRLGKEATQAQHLKPNQSVACPQARTEEAGNKTKIKLNLSGRVKEIQQSGINCEKTEGIVVLGTKSQQLKRIQQEIPTNTLAKKGKYVDSGVNISSSQSVLGKEGSQGQHQKVNLENIPPEKQRTTQVPGLHSQSVTGSEANAHQTEIGNQINRKLIAQEVEREIVHLQKNNVIEISGGIIQRRMKLGQIRRAMENLLKFEEYCKVISEGTLFTRLRMETFSLSAYSELPQARLAFTFGGTGIEPGKFCGSRAVAVDEDQLVYVVDSRNRRIQVFNQDLNFLFQFGTGYLTVPNDIAITRNSSGTDMILVSDEGDKDVKLFTCLSGHFIRILGLCLTGSPAAVSANSHGTVVVAEVRDERKDIIVCDLFGNISSTFRTSASLCSLYSGLLVNDKGKIFIPNMIAKDLEELLMYHYQGMWVRKHRRGCQLQGQVVGISEVGEDLLVASLKDARLRLTLCKCNARNGYWTILFMLDSDQKLTFIPCSFTLLSFSPLLRVVVGDQEDNLHVLSVRSS